SESEFQNIVKGHKLLIDHKMPMDDLKGLINIGFTTLENELLSPLNNALETEKLNLEKKKEDERKIIINDREIIEKIILNRLKETYSTFEDSTSINKINHSSHKSNDGCLEISNEKENWIELRKLFEFSTHYIAELKPAVEEGSETGQDNNGSEAIKELFVDQVIDFNKQVKKYSQEQKKKGQKISKKSIISDVEDKVNKKTDIQFIHDLYSYKYYKNVDD
ncbi:14748_t:CDS:2, partial [Gigaspora rosea]